MPIQSWLARANRTGTFTTNNLTVPSNLSGYYWIRTNIIGNQIEDTTKSVTILIEVSDDGGTTWRQFLYLSWTGCPVWKGSGNPGFVVDVSQVAGKTIRATVTVNSQINIGMDIETA